MANLFHASGPAPGADDAPIPPSPSGLNPVGLPQVDPVGGIQNLLNLKPRTQIYDYRYDDEDTIMKELDELYSYVESSHSVENIKAWEGSFDEEWTQSTPQRRKAHVEVLLEGLEHRDPDVRYVNSRRVLFLVQGIYTETTSAEDQLHWIIENCKIVRDANGVTTLVNAIKHSNSKHDFLSSISDDEAEARGISAEGKARFIEEFVTELFMYFSSLYHLVEVLKSYEGFSDELMSLDPPLPVFLFTLIASLRERSIKSYPLKKLLLLTWKTILACFGGTRDISRVKTIARELHHLPPDQEEFMIKSSPFDIQQFRNDTFVKYPTFAPDQAAWQASHTESSDLSSTTSTVPPPEKLAQIYAPIPIRPHYHHGDDSDFHPSRSTGASGQSSQMHPGAGANPLHNPTPVPQMATPAPTPPHGGAKPKKQQYQTDQNRPFLFPFSRRTQYNASGRLVPFAIDEAEKLYYRHMRVSVALLQMWRTREDCMIAESGLEQQHSDSSLMNTFESALNFGGSSSDRKSYTAADSVEDPVEEHQDMVQLDLLLAEVDEKIEEVVKSGSRADAKTLKELKKRREDLMRLKRVEQVYGMTLPVLPAFSAALVKFLMAAVGASGPQGPPPSATTAAFPMLSTPEQPPPPPPPPTKEDIDIARHREINNEAVSAIILLLLKWFKVSHVMKYHYFGQLLLDTNCLLLIMKMFILTDLATHVQSRAESPEHNFFRYCQSMHSKAASGGEPEDALNQQSRQSRSTIVKNKHGEEIEVITSYSWRNFFSSINFLKIMQKLSKGRSHRIWLLVQFKSTVVLKRMTKVPQPEMQAQVLKLIKSQVPYCGRKWRTTNMKVITAIYLKLRPDLRDEWLTATEVDDVQDALAQEQALRKLVKFYNTKRYGAIAVHAASAYSKHARSSSVAGAPLEGMQAPPETLAMLRPVATPNMVEADVFPPLRAQAPDPSIFLPYMTEDIAFEDEYEEYLRDLNTSASHEEHPLAPTDFGSLFGGMTWHRMPHLGVPDMTDNMSDTESIGSIVDFGDEASKLGVTDSERESESIDENRNNWEHMSPKTMAALPKSPVGKHRRSSSGGGLRPVLPFGLDDGSAVELEHEDDIDEAELGPVPREQPGPFPAGAGVDEVEYAYGV